MAEGEFLKVGTSDVIAAILQLEHALNGLTDGEVGHFVRCV